jgi:hypothetical protein
MKLFGTKSKVHRFLYNVVKGKQFMHTRLMFKNDFWALHQ